MRLVILGMGGYGRTIADLAEQSGRYDEILFLDDCAPEASGKCSDFENLVNSGTEFYPAFGDNTVRLNWIETLEEAGANLVTLIHRTAYVSPKANIGKGTAVLPNASVGTNAGIGKGCIINMNAVVDHDVMLEDGVHICLGAVVKAGIIIKERVKIEAGEVIKK